MFRLMVVDDEYNIRDGIANTIPWIEYGVEVVGEAINGIDALKKLDELKPDIIISDIHMDDLNGLDFTEAVKKLNPDIKIILISGYDEFEYAKRAIELKVFSYILKPILAEELIKIVLKLVEEINQDKKIKQKICSLEEEQKENRAVLQDKYLIELIEGRLTGKDELLRRAGSLNIEFNKPYYLCLVFNIDGYYDLMDTRNPNEINFLTMGIKEIASEISNRYFESYVIIYNSGNLVSIIGQEVGTSRDFWSQLYDSIEAIKDSISKMLGITVSVGVSSIHENILDIRKAFTEAERALEHKLIVGKDCIINIDDIASISGNKYIYPADKEMQLLSSLNENNADKIKVSIKGFFSELENQKYLKNRMKIAIMQLFAVVARKLMDMGADIYVIYERKLVDPYVVLERFDTLEEIQNWMINIIQGAINKIQQDRKDDVKSVIRKAQEFILNNFSRPDISLTAIAENMYLTPAYFSKLYKKETGESYIECLTKIRIEEAKRLLKKTNLKIADIGNATGYPSAQYFCTLFKKSMGISPAEYREQIRR